MEIEHLRASQFIGNFEIISPISSFISTRNNLRSEFIIDWLISSNIVQSIFVMFRVPSEWTLIYITTKSYSYYYYTFLVTTTDRLGSSIEIEPAHDTARNSVLYGSWRKTRSDRH